MKSILENPVPSEMYRLPVGRYFQITRVYERLLVLGKTKLPFEAFRDNLLKSPDFGFDLGKKFVYLK